MQTRTISPRLVLVAIVPVAIGLVVLIAVSGPARGFGYPDAAGESRRTRTNHHDIARDHSIPSTEV